MDCVRVSSNVCYIVEIKPSNPNAISKGQKRAREYLDAVSDFFGQNRNRVKEAFTGKLEVFQKCIANGGIKLDTEVRAYDLCPPDGRLFQDFVVTE